MDLNSYYHYDSSSESSKNDDSNNYTSARLNRGRNTTNPVSYSDQRYLLSPLNPPTTLYCSVKREVISYSSVSVLEDSMPMSPFSVESNCSIPCSEPDRDGRRGGGSDGSDESNFQEDTERLPSISLCSDDHCSLRTHNNHDIVMEGGGCNSGKLSMAGLAVMIFYSVSGGPFGIEASVRSAGNFYTICGFLVFPFVWSLQEAMMTAELGAAFPEASGGVAWVEEAFGAKAGFLSGFLGWVAGATDNAIYPVLFLDYLLEVVQNDSGSEEMNPIVRFCLLAFTSIGLSYVNWLGLPVVGNMSIVICALAMSPFIILTVVGVFQIDPSRWFLRPSMNSTLIDSIMDDDAGGILPISTVSGVMLRPFLNNLFWNLNSFDAGASFAEDIEDPGRVLPRAMGYGLIMVTLGYIIPLLVALGASDAPQEAWVDGYLARICSQIVGPWLGAWTVFAAGISNIALFQAELSADAFQLMGMAERGHLPKLFATRSRHGTPTFGIIIGCAVIVIMGAANVDRLIEMLNFNYALALLMEYGAFLRLRIERPDLPRPFRIPLNTFGCIVALIPTFGFTLFVLALADYSTYFFAVLVNSAGLGFYYCMRRARDQEQGDHFLSLCTNRFSKRYNRVDSDSSTVRTESSDSNVSDSTKEAVTASTSNIVFL